MKKNGRKQIKLLIFITVILLPITTNFFDRNEKDGMASPVNEPGVFVEKNVRNEENEEWKKSIHVDIGEKVRFRVMVETGEDDFDYMNITDSLPYNLKYKDNAFICFSSGGSPWTYPMPCEPDFVWNNNLTWIFSDNIEPGMRIMLIFWAEVEYPGIAISVVNVACWNGHNASHEDNATVIAGFIADADGPYEGMATQPIQFQGSAIGGYPPYTWHWDFGDNNVSDEKNPLHVYNKSGNYTAILMVKDSADSPHTANDTAKVTIFPCDKEPPLMEITKPRKALYIHNKEILPLFQLALIIGEITVEVDAKDRETGIEKVEFYIDNERRHVDNEEPYKWEWDERKGGWHTLKVIAYDKTGNSASDQLLIWKWD